MERTWRMDAYVQKCQGLGRLKAKRQELNSSKTIRTHCYRSRQMFSKEYRIILYALILIGIAIMLTIPDVVIGLLYEVVHLFFELLFISFEWLESILDTIVEHLFHTELHETQIIVFYLIIGIVAIPLYYLWRMLLRIIVQFKKTSHRTQETLSLYRIQAILYWQNLPFFGKIMMIAISASILYLASFLFM